MTDSTEITLAPIAQPAQQFGQFMMEVLRDKDIPAEKLEVVLRARQAVLEQEARESFYFAFARMQQDMPQIEKRGVVELITKDGRELGRYNFARWEDIDAHIRPILIKHGFGLSFSSREADANKTMIMAELSYGAFAKTAEIALPPDAGPGRNSLQAVGGSLSYGQRYLAQLLLNIVRKGEDDDATSLREKKITPDQVAELTKLLTDTRTTLSEFLKVMVTGATELKDIPARDYVRLINALNQKKRRGAA